MTTESLPIDEVLPQVIAALRVSLSVVLRAPTGAGKTTRVPPALLDAGLLGERRVIVLEPRRVAARAAARRMAFERGCSLGDEVGYQVRFDRKWNAKTRILVVTEGTLVRMLQDDPFLDDIAAVVFDEFHERSLDTDLSLGMVRRVQQTVRPELKIVVMSATLGVEAISQFLGDCPIVVSEGRLYPVAIEYSPRGDSTPLSVAVTSAVADLLRQTPNGTRTDQPERASVRFENNNDNKPDASAFRLIIPPVNMSAIGQTPGDVLVFLPGQREIRETARELDSLARQYDLLIMPLYGELPPEQQDAALMRQAKRKIVLATNVAETSVTVDGVTAVVDTGLARQLRFDPNSGLNRLDLRPISRASADQRAGRAGRQQPGICVRLWSEPSQRARPEQTEPEIRRVDLTGSVLQLKAWGEADLLAFPWFEPPRVESIAQAEHVLRRLEAIDDVGGVTALGAMLAKFPVHPRLGRLLIEGARLGQPARAALAAALLAERDPFGGDAGSSGDSRQSPRHGGAASCSDVLDRVEALEDFERSRREMTSFGRVNRGAAQFLLQTRDQLLRLVDLRDQEQARRTGTLVRPTLDDGQECPSYKDAALGRALLAAFPDRLAKRREAKSPRAIMVGGRGVRLSPSSRVTQGDLFLCLDVDAGSAATTPAQRGPWSMTSVGEGLARIASEVERSWLPEELVTIATEVYFDESTQRVQARRQVRWEDLVLEESPAALPQDNSVARMLAEAALRNWDRVRPKEDSAASHFLTRVLCLREWMPDLELPAFDEAHLQTLLPTLCAGRRSLAELSDAPWLDVLQSQMSHQQLQAVEREAPERISVPSGSRITLLYERGRPPVLAVRIQEIFGLRETPRVARGRVKVLLHLLAPSYRPQQITDDLASFWATAYPQIRSELRRRYPKHAWPDDPLTATPERRPGKRPVG